MANIQQKIVPFLTFNNNAEEAVRFYTSVFKDSSIEAISYYGQGAPAPEGSVMTVSFTLFGTQYIALNGGPSFSFSEGVSFTVYCESQEEVDHYWNKLTADGGKGVACGWLKDKFGLPWQVTPVRLIELITHKDKAIANRAMQAMMQMIKIDLPALEKAVAGS